MDNLTHSLVGLVGAKAGLERVSPYATIVCVLAANLPDADIVTLAGGSLTYLEHHRGITHSIVGTLALGIIFPFLFWAVERLVARVRGRSPRARLGGLVLASFLLTASHPLLDWTNSYGVRPFLPWSGQWFYGDIVFVIDPWLWLLLGGACFLLTAKTNLRVALWSVFGIIVAAAVLFLPERRLFEIPLSLRLLWVALLVAIAFAHRARLAAQRETKIAAAVLIAVVIYWGALALLQSRAHTRAQAAAAKLADARGETLRRVAAMPLPMNPLRWLSVSETDRATYRFVVRLETPEQDDLATPSARYERPPEQVVEKVRGDVRGRIFLDFARFPVFRLRGEGAAQRTVRITDVRFNELPEDEQRGGGSFTIEVPLADDGGESK